MISKESYGVTAEENELLLKKLQHVEEALQHIEEELQQKEDQIRHQKERIAYLERMLYGLHRDKLSAKGPEEDNQPTLFDDEFKQAMEAMEQWMIVASTQCTPSDSMGEALDYAYRLWPRLSRYALDGRYQLDNNGVEQGQRPTVMGRKNFLFSKNDCGALDNAIFYSLIGSCEAVGIEPLKWLTDILEKLTDDMSPEQVRALLPFYYKKARE